MISNARGCNPPAQEREMDSECVTVCITPILRAGYQSRNQKFISRVLSPILPSLFFLAFPSLPSLFPLCRPPLSGRSNPAKGFGGTLLAPTGVGGEERHLQPADTFPQPALNTHKVRLQPSYGAQTHF